MTVIGILAATALAASLHSNAQLLQPAAMNGMQVAESPAYSTTTVRVCNNSSRNISVAVNYEPVGAGGNSLWRYEGWKKVSAGQCGTLFTTAHAVFYLRAESDDNSNTVWGSGYTECVEYPGPYDFSDDGNQSQCPSGAEAVAFTPFTLSNPMPPTYTWTLTD